MAGTINDNYVAKMLAASFLTKYQGKFAVNDEFKIEEEDFLALVQDMANNMVFQSGLTALTVRGNTLPLQNKDELATADPGTLVVGQFANVADNVTAAEAAANIGANIAAKPTQYRLMRDSAGVQFAFVNAKPSTTARTRVSWVLVSGSEEEKVLSYQSLQLEDYPLSAGDVRKWTFPDGQTRLLEIKRSLPLAGAGDFNPDPSLSTGLDNNTDLNYRLFSPLKGDVTRDEVLALINVRMTLAEAQAAAPLGKLTGMLLRITGRPDGQLDIIVPVVTKYAVAAQEAYEVLQDNSLQPVAYTLATDTTAPRELTPEQAQRIQALSSPFYSPDQADLTKLRGYPTLVAGAAALQDSGSYLEVQGGAIDTVEENLQTSGITVLGRGQTIHFTEGVTWEVTGTTVVKDLFLAEPPFISSGFGPQPFFSMYGGGIDGIMPRGGRFHDVDLSGATLTDLQEPYYLFGDTPDPLSIAPGVVIEDRRGGPGGQGGTAYTLPAATANTRGGMRLGPTLQAAGDIVDVNLPTVDVTQVSGEKRNAIINQINASLNASGPGWVLDSATTQPGDPIPSAGYVERGFVDVRTANTYGFKCVRTLDAGNAELIIWYRYRIQ